LLKIALDSLLTQEYYPDDYEILVVDNNSTDDTRSVTENAMTLNSNIRYIFEEKQGLSHARNRGWQEAQGEYVAYIDDDCKVPPEWLQVAVEIMDKIDPQVFGGPYFAYYNSPKQKWIKDEYFSHITSEMARPLYNSEYLDGGNMFIRRELFESSGGFPLSLGMVGKQIAFGEETHFINKLRSNTPQAIVYYDPRLFVYHLVRTEKMVLRKAPRYFFIDGRYSYRVFNK
jgi:glycosyltransferase involved in cell wall biosynthesis